jgi:hypothetical protein
MCQPRSLGGENEKAVVNILYIYILWMKMRMKREKFGTTKRIKYMQNWEKIKASKCVNIDI